MSKTTPWRRHALGAIAISLIAAGVLIWWIPGAATDWAFAQGVCIKSGTTLLILWLAYPQLVRLNPLTVVPLLLIVALLTFRPSLIPVVVRVLISVAPILFLIWLLRLPAKGRTR